MKKIIYILLALIAIFVIALTLGFDTLGKKYAQQYAQELLKTPVHISQFNSSLFGKSLNIDFIEVQNPPNFNNKNALSLAHFSLQLGAISGNLITIDQLYFDGLHFVLEQSNSKVNLTQLLNNLDQSKSRSPIPLIEKNSKEIDDTRIKIKHFKVSNITLKVDTKWLKTTLKVADISANNFGGKSGVKIDEIGTKIAQTILQNLKKSLKKQGIETGKKKIKQSLRRKIEQKLGIDNLKNTFDTDALENKVKSLFKELGF